MKLATIRLTSSHFVFAIMAIVATGEAHAAALILPTPPLSTSPGLGTLFQWLVALQG